MRLHYRAVAGIDDFNPSIVADGAGGAIVAWTRGSTGTYDIYSQRVASRSGTTLVTGPPTSVEYG